MDLKAFKREAMRRGGFYDNGPAAGAYWAKTWGLGFHDLLWRYKSYKVGNMLYKSGPVVLRHGKYTNTVCYIDDQPVSEYRFKKALETYQAPPLTTDEQKYIDDQNARQAAAIEAAKVRRPTHRRGASVNDSRQLSLAFC